MSATDPATAPAAAPAPRASNAKVLAVITVIIAFVVGAILGAAGALAWMHHRGGRPLLFSEFGEQRILRHLDRELSLTPQQHDAIAKIIHERRQRIDAIFGGLRPEVRREIDLANQEIEKLLTPEQKVKFEQSRMRLHSRRHMPAASSPAGSPTQ